jgi:tetratricopeptide (TPR) repeat protein
MVVQFEPLVANLETSREPARLLAMVVQDAIREPGAPLIAAAIERILDAAPAHWGEDSAPLAQWLQGRAEQTDVGDVLRSDMLLAAGDLLERACGKVEDAIHRWRDAFRANPYNHRALQRARAAFVAQGRLDMVRRLWELQIKAAPNAGARALAKRGLAGWLREQGQEPELQRQLLADADALEPPAPATQPPAAPAAPVVATPPPPVAAMEEPAAGRTFLTISSLDGEPLVQAPGADSGHEAHDPPAAPDAEVAREPEAEEPASSAAQQAEEPASSAPPEAEEPASSAAPEAEEPVAASSPAPEAEEPVAASFSAPEAEEPASSPAPAAENPAAPQPVAPARSPGTGTRSSAASSGGRAVVDADALLVEAGASEAGLREALDALPAAGPGRATALGRLATHLAAARGEDNPEARALAAEALTMVPGSAALMDLYARLWRSTGDWEGLLSRYEAAVAHAQSATERTELAARAGTIAWQQLGSWPRAEAMFRRVRLADARHPDVLRFAVAQAEHEDNPRKLQSALQALLARVSEDEWLATQRRLAALAEGPLEQPARAVDVWLAVLREHPGQPEALKALERLYASLGRWNRLVELLREQESAATDAAARQALQASLFAVCSGPAQLPLVADAVAADMLETDPMHPEAAAWLHGRWTAAERWEELGPWLLARGRRCEDADAACTLLREAASVFDGRLHDSAGALEALQELAVRTPDDPALFAQLAHTLQQAGRWPEWVSLRRQRLRVLPAAARAAWALETLEEATRQALPLTALQADRVLADPVLSADALQAALASLSADGDAAALATFLEDASRLAEGEDAAWEALARAAWMHEVSLPALDARLRAWVGQDDPPARVQAVETWLQGRADAALWEEHARVSGRWAASLVALQALAWEGDAGLRRRVASLALEEADAPAVAVELLLPCVAEAPGDPALLVMLVEAQRRTGDAAGEAEALRMLLAQTDDAAARASVLDDLVRVLSHHADTLQAATEAAMDAFEASPDEARADRAGRLAARADLLDAWCDRLVAIAEPGGAFWPAAVTLLQSLDRWSEVETGWARCVADGNVGEAAWEGWAQALQQQARWDDLAAVLEQAIAAAASESLARRWRYRRVAVLGQQLGQPAEACAELRAIVEADPADTEAWSTLADLALGNADWALVNEAAAALETLDDAPAGLAAWLQARAAVALASWDDAVLHLTRAVEQAPSQRTDAVALASEIIEATDRVDLLETMAPWLEAGGEAAMLASLWEQLAPMTPTPASCLRQAARLRGEVLGERDAAWQLWCRIVLEEAPSQATLETLQTWAPDPGAMLDAWMGLVTTHGAAATPWSWPALPDALSAAERRADAVAMWQLARETRPEVEEAALDALTPLLEAEGAWHALVEVLHARRTRGSETEQAGCWSRIAAIQETYLGQPEEALRSLREALVLDPWNQPAFARLHALHQSMDLEAQLAPLLEIRLRLAPSLGIAAADRAADALMLAGLRLRDGGNLLPVLEALEEAIACEADAASVLPRAREVFDAVGGADRESMPAGRMVLALLTAMGDRAGMDAHAVDWSVCAEPDDRPEIARCHAEALETLGDPEAAMAVLAEALVADPTRPSLLRALMDRCERADAWSAHAPVLAAAAVAQGEAGVLDTLVAWSVRSGEQAPARFEWHEQAMGLREASTSDWTSLLAWLPEGLPPSRSAQVLQRAADALPDHPDRAAWRSRAAALQAAEGDFESAIVLWEALWAEGQADDATLDALAEALRTEGRWGSLVALSESRLPSLPPGTPERTEALRALALLCEVQLDDPAQAAYHLTVWAEECPDDAEAWSWLARLHAEAGRHELLAEALRAWIPLLDEDARPTVRLQFAGALVDADLDPAEAVAALAECLDSGWLAETADADERTAWESRVGALRRSAEAERDALALLVRWLRQTERREEQAEALAAQAALTGEPADRAALLDEAAAAMEEAGETAAALSLSLDRFLVLPSAEVLPRLESLSVRADAVERVEAHLEEVLHGALPARLAADVHAMLARLCDVTGRPAQASGHLQLASQLQPQDTALAEALEARLVADADWAGLSRWLEQQVALAAGTEDALMVRQRLDVLNRETLNDTTAALDNARAALQLDPTAFFALDTARTLLQGEPGAWAAMLADLIARMPEGAEQAERRLDRVEALLQDAPSEATRMTCLEELALARVHLPDAEALGTLWWETVEGGAWAVVAWEETRLLCRWMEAHGRWDEAIVLARALGDAADDPDMRLLWWSEAADWLRDHAGDPAQALQLRARIVADTDPVTVALARDLVEEARGVEGAWYSVAETLRTLAERTEGATAAGIWDMVADVELEFLEDLDAACDALARGLEQDPSEEARHRSRFRLLQRAERPAELLSALETFASAWPDDAAACDALVQAAALVRDGQGDLAGSIPWLERALERVPDHPAARRHLLSALERLGRWHDLRAWYAHHAAETGLWPRWVRALCAEGGDPEALTSALRGMEAGEGPIIDVLEVLLELAFDHQEPTWAAVAEVACTLAEAHAGADLQTRCFTWWAGGVDPETLSDPTRLRRLASVLEDESRLRTVLERLARLTDDPQDWAALRDRMKADGQGVGWLELLQERWQVSADPDQRRALVHAWLEDAELAGIEADVHLAGIREALEACPGDEPAVAALEEWGLGQGDWEVVEEAARLRLDAAPDSAARHQAAMALGQIRRDQLGAWEEAIDAFQIAVDELPNDAAALEALGWCQQEAGQWLDAATTLEVLAVASDDPALAADARMRLARVRLEHLGDAEGAIDALEPVIAEAQAARADDEVLTLLWALADDAPRAVQWLSVALGPSPTDAERARLLDLQLVLVEDPAERSARHSELADLLDGDPDMADRAFHHRLQAMQSAPGDEEARQALQLAVLGDPDRVGTLDAMVTRLVAQTEAAELRHSLRLWMADLWLRLTDDGAARAEALLRAVLDDAPGMQAASEALRAILEGSGRREAVVDLLVAQADASDEDEAAALHWQAIAVCEEDSALAARALDILESLPASADRDAAFERIAADSGAWDRLRQDLQRRLERPMDEAERGRLLLQLGGCLRDGLGDMDGAAAAWEEASLCAATESDALHALTALYAAQDEPVRLCAVLEQRIERENDPGERSRLAAFWVETAQETGDATRVADAWEARLIHDEEGAVDWAGEAAAALEADARWSSLDALLARAAEAADGPSLRAEWLCRRARLLTATLDRPEDAASLLQEAGAIEGLTPQERVPVLLAAADAWLAQQEREMARMVLEEAVPSLPDSVVPTLWDRLADLIDPDAEPDAWRAACLGALQGGRLTVARLERLEDDAGSGDAAREGVWRMIHAVDPRVLPLDRALRWAHLLRQREDREGVLEVLTPLFHAAESDPRVVRMLVASMLELGRVEPAAATLDAWSERPEIKSVAAMQPTALFLRGRVALARGQRAEALDAFMRAYALDTALADNLLALGTLHLAEGRLDDAVRVLQAAMQHQGRMESDAQRLDLYLLMAQARSRGGDFTRARDMVGRALALAPDHPRALALQTELSGR